MVTCLSSFPRPASFEFGLFPLGCLVLPGFGLAIGAGNQGNHFFVGLFRLVQQSLAAAPISQVGAAKVCSDTAWILPEPSDHLGMEVAAVAVGPEHGHSRPLVPIGQVPYGIFEILKTEHIDVWLGCLDYLHGKWGVGLIAIAQDKMMLVVAAHGVVRDFVILSGQFEQFLAA